MSTANVVLNSDGSVTFNTVGTSMVDGVTGTYVDTTTWSASSVAQNEQLMAQVVTQNLGANSTITPIDVVSANLAVQNGLMTEAQLQAWATNNHITVDQIYTSTPTSGTLASATPSTTESFMTAASDPLVTSNGGEPTLAQATASAAITSQASGEPATGPAQIAGVSAGVQQIEEAYVAYYGRPADPAGLTYWVTALNAAGGNLSTIINAFGNSAESQALYSGQSNTQIVTSIYQQELGRAPDAGGLAYYVGELNSGKMSAAAAALIIFNGATGTDQALINNKIVVAEAFTNALTSDSTANSLYAGNAAAANARTYLSQVNTSNPQTVTLAGIADHVGHDIQSAANVASDITGAGITLVGMPSATAVAAHQVVHFA